MNRIIVRGFSLSKILGSNRGGSRRNWKPYYNNRHGYARSWTKARIYYEGEFDSTARGAETGTLGVDNDWRIRNKWPQVNMILFSSSHF